MRPYAIYGPTGELKYLGLHEDEDDCWTIYLGWPHPDDVAYQRTAGFTCKEVAVLPINGTK